MKVEDIVDNILFDKNSYEIILAYITLYKKCMDVKLFPIRFDKADGLIKIYDGIRHFELSNSYNEVYSRNNSTIYSAMFDKINYLISEKSGITGSVNHILAKIIIDSCNSLPIEKKLTLHNVVILIKPVFDKDKNNYYYNIFLEKGSYRESNTQYF